MNPYQYYVPSPSIPYNIQQVHYNPYRQQQAQGVPAQHVKEVQRLNSELGRQNKEVIRLNGEIHRLNQEINRQNDVQLKHARHLNRLNQRLRVVENRLTIPFKPSEGGF